MNMRRLLVVGPSWVGDMVMAQSLFRILKDQDDPLNRETQITVLAPNWSEPVLARMPEVAKVEIMPIGHGRMELKTRYRLGRRFRSKKFDQAIILPGSLKSALIPWFARIPKRTGFLKEPRFGLVNDLRTLEPKQLPLNVQRYAALGFDASHPPSDRAIQSPPNPKLHILTRERAATLQRFNLTTDTPILALCPGAEYGPAKQWPAKHFAAVAKTKLSQGWQVWIFGSAKDQKIANEINEIAGGGCQSLTGATSLGEAIDLLSLCRYVVTNDSGLMHVAAAVGCEVVAIYGSSSDQFTPPLTERCHKMSIDIDCRPCFKRHCPLGHTNCLVKLDPNRVLSAISPT